LKRDHALKESVIAVASALEEKQTIPMVREQMMFIQEVQTAQFWEGVTLPELEGVRQRLRALVKFIDKDRRTPVYTNFEDELRGSEPVLLPGSSVGVDTERFREKVLAFLRDKLEHPALHKVRWNEALTPEDIASLEAMLVDAGIGTSAQVREIAQREHGLGLFLRSLVGLDRAAAKRAFSQFPEMRQLNAQQLTFLNLIIDHLTQCGWMRPEQLYSSPFTDQFSGGPNSVFNEHQSLQHLLSSLMAVRLNASGTT
jgi:type I restriction enzyme R subunit